MTRGEKQTPQVEQILVLEGRASADAIEVLATGLSRAPSTNERVLFASFASAEFELGHSFDIVFPELDPTAGVEARSVIVEATQQFGRPFKSVPHGWKTVLLMDFPSGVPREIDALETVDAWYESSARVCVASRAAWEARLGQHAT